MSKETYEAGHLAYHAWMASGQYAQFDKSTSARDVMKLFMPNVPEDMMQVARPLPGPFKDWIKGFEDAKRETLV